MDTYELIVTINSEIYENDNIKGLRVILVFKNKAIYEISNLIVMINSNKVKDSY